MDTKTEPLLEPDDNRFVMFPIKYDDIWEMYKKQIDCFWRTEEIDLTKDMTHWDSLNADEKYFISMILAFFAASDGIVLENLATRFMKDVQVSEARAFYGFQIAMENIHCVTGNTKILTDRGYYKIQDLENNYVNVWNGNEFSNVQIKYTGNQAIYRVSLSNGMELECTPGHKWLLKSETDILEVKTENLHIKNIIADYKIPVVDFSNDSENKDEMINPYTHGIFCEYGFYSDNDKLDPMIKIDLEYDDKILSLIRYNSIVEKDGFVSLNVKDCINREKYYVPINYSINTRLRWLEGIVDSCGFIHGTSNWDTVNCVFKDKYEKPPTLIHIWNENMNFLKDIQLLLTTLGISSHIDNEVKFPYNVNGKTIMSILVINRTNVKELMKLGFYPNKSIFLPTQLYDLGYKYNNDADGFNNLKITGIEKISEDEKTYCFNEPLKHRGIFNGILTCQSETYSVLIETYIKNKELKNQYFNAISHYPCIQKKAKWAQKWIHDKNSDFATRLVGFACVEGIFFSGAFCSIFWLKKRGLMPGLTFSNELISRDEALHCEFAILLYNKLNDKLDRERIHEIIKEAVEIETEFICEALPCRLIGMNADMMTQYIKFVADRLSLQLGYPKIYNASNCFPWMELISLESKTNFFEKRNDSYALATKKVDDNTFDINEDF
jgi:ribonucleotide reductase beta subunit family protein with ferritin-like domain